MKINTYFLLPFCLLIVLFTPSLAQTPNQKTSDNVTFNRLDNYNHTLDSLQGIINQAEKNSDIKEMIKAMEGLATTYLHNKRFDEAIEQYKVMLAHTEREGLLDWMAKGTANLALAYNRKGDLEMAIETYEKAINWFEKAGMENNLSLLFLNMGVAYKELEAFEKSIELFQRALDMETQNNSPTKQVIIIEHIALLYEKMGDLAQSRAYYEKSIKIAREIELERKILTGNMGMIDSYIKEKDYSSARKYSMENMSLLSEKNDARVLHINYKRLAEIEAALKNYPAAFDAMSKAYVYRDSIQVQKERIELDKTRDQFQLAETRILAQQRELEIQKNKALRLQLLAILFGAILIIGGLFLFFRIRSNRAQKKAESLERKIFQLQMNPHFFFNALTSIQENIYDKKPQEAASHLGHLGRLFRKTLEYSRKETIKLEEEVEFLDNYLKLQQLRFRDKFHYEIDFPENLLCTQIPPMIIQPFVENTLEHGQIFQKENGKVLIKGYEENGLLQIK